ncbi:hypothetical protein [Streptomyces flavofungini]|uniref:Uncharacterized protein n=1 Tax=Streptomyces flavofungini TaxID=68200 RepID=A0ABS0WXA7_9ACTN|nr:hypothetical protein [Streptomyces flavofungini]MBJ3805562.1 hypothetical protein [Streptomyces flavofungini]GHC73167.1 hypothetical protein GCM10010349_50670 [Streptomyces flavofungini]
MTTAGADWRTGFSTPRNVVITSAHVLSDKLWERYNSAVALDGRHRASSLLSVLSATIRFHEYLDSQPDYDEWGLRATIARTAEKDTLLPQATALSLQSAGAPPPLTYPAMYAEQARRLADSMCALIALIRQDLAKELVPCDYEYVDTVPRHDRSPCGVVRLTTPTIPRAPGRPNSPSISTRWGVSAARPPGEAHAA